jgi:RHS repeat-associated protein
MDGRAVAVIEGGEVFFVRTDHIGRPVFATNDLGLKVWEASYLPFGGVHVSTGGIALRFPGQWFQSESGLHQNWMRDYDPTTGRYLQADPLGLVDGASVYGYALGNPGRYVDPRGEDSDSISGSGSPFPVPTWPGERYPGQLGESMLDLLKLFSPVPLVQAIVEACTAEEDCLEQYNREMNGCNEVYAGCLRLVGVGIGSRSACGRARALCATNAFSDYQRCRGY